MDTSFDLYAVLELYALAQEEREFKRLLAAQLSWDSFVWTLK
jgi:hypothetical protein